MRLGRIGFDHVGGYLDGGPAALAARPELVARVSRVDADELARAAGRAPRRRWCSTCAGRARSRPDTSTARSRSRCRSSRSASAEVPRDRPLVLQCAGGYRSTIAASLLEPHGFEGLTDLVGGFGAWSRAGHPVVVPERVQGP